MTRPQNLPVALVLPMMLVGGIGVAADEGPTDPPGSLARYLATFELDAASREEGDAGWNDARRNLALRLLSRLAKAPRDRWDAWVGDAGEPAEAVPAPDRLVRVAGRAVFAGTIELPPHERELHARREVGLVRLVGEDGIVVDILTDHVPISWPRWQEIDEPSAVVGLVIGRGSGPQPTTEGGAWPKEPADLVLAARRVAWYPATPLGSLGMDYGLFDTVVDGRRLVPGDTDAFYAMLAAAGRGTQQGIEEAAGRSTDIIPLIDPKAGWFEAHRGDAVVIRGVARRAIRIAIDDEFRRRAAGTDHYWELYVFSPTPGPVKIRERVQDNYPIVCCVRRLPEGMPRGASIGEEVEVAGFALKRYRYPTSEPGGDGSVDQESPLVIGKRAVWFPSPSSEPTSTSLGWIFGAVLGLTTLILAVGSWVFLRDSARRDRARREQFPDEVGLPEPPDDGSG